MVVNLKIPGIFDPIEKIMEYAQKKFDIEKINKEIEEIRAKVPTHNPRNSTVIRGGYAWDTCFRYACYLAKYIYSYQGRENKGGDEDKEYVNPNYFTEYPEKMKEVKAHWDLWEPLTNNPSGLVAGLYKQKGYEPQSKTDLCPPILVFRGTDFEDMRGVALLFEITFHLSIPMKSEPVPVTFRYSLTPEHIGEEPPTWDEWVKNMDGRIEELKEEQEEYQQRQAAQTGNQLVNTEDWGWGFLGWGPGWERNREKFLEEGYEEFTIYNRSTTISVQAGETWFGPFYVKATFDLTARLYAKKDGDWSNNIKQGLGYESEQYKEAIRLGRQIAKGKIATAEDKRLTITGHSLGGGLASAVSCILTAEYSDIVIQSIIFNAAGVHKNTIIRALGSEKRALKAMRDHLCFDICVRDEILTTLGVHYRKLPILGGAFALFQREIDQYGFPNPDDIAKIMDIKAISPGTQVEMAKNGKVATAFPPKGAALPILFPLDKQEAMPPPENGFPILNALEGILNRSPDIGLLATHLVEFLNDRYGKESRRNNKTPYGTYQEIFRKLMEEVKPEIKVLMPVMALCLAYHGMDVVIASYENMLIERALRKDGNQQGIQQREQEQQRALEAWQKQEWAQKAAEETKEQEQKRRDEQARREAIQRRMERVINPWELTPPL